ncbi:MAG: hypothetical protein ABIK28_14165 [Planctomycetota bacterium]
MIDVEEHRYNDDPAEGHPDVRTFLKQVSYFFLGNGHIQAAVQVAPGGEGTPLGLILMKPDRLIKKREALSFDAATGFESTGLRVAHEHRDPDPIPLKSMRAAWIQTFKQPAVEVAWSTEEFKVREQFFCPDRSAPRLCRRIRFTSLSGEPLDLNVETGVRNERLKKRIFLPPSGCREMEIEYALTGNRDAVKLRLDPGDIDAEETGTCGLGPTSIRFGRPDMDHLFDAARFQLPAVVSSTGKVDASLWQYNREWVRDHGFMGIGLTLSGHHDVARTLLDRLLKEFVTEEGDTIDSSARRDPEDVELDQNGILLYAIGRYALWTGDLDLAAENWKTIEKTAAYPFGKIFQHRHSGMLHNSREFWERHSAFGIHDGLELMYQFFNVEGLKAAASLARALSRPEQARKWEIQAKELQQAMLHHPEFALLDDRGFIKRRGLNGLVQEAIPTCPLSGLPQGVPLTRHDEEHFLNPDASSALPIAHGLVSPDSAVAKATLDHLEILWNQGWETGGYGRYDMSSEADSAGAWPFASLFIARACMEAKRYDKVERILKWLHSIPGALSGSFFEMYGPRISPPFAQVGITPWTWAEMVVLCIHHIAGIRPEEECIRIRPNLLSGMHDVQGDLLIRGRTLHIEYKTGQDGSGLEIKTNAKIIDSREGEVRVRL